MAKAKALSALQVLMEDHDYVKQSYRAFQKLDPEEDAEEVRALVRQVCAALKVRRARFGKDPHPPARTDATAQSEIRRDLHGALRVHRAHVKEEESEMFPKVRRARVNLAALGRKLMARKIKLAP